MKSVNMQSPIGVKYVHIQSEIPRTPYSSVARSFPFTLGGNGGTGGGGEPPWPFPKDPNERFGDDAIAEEDNEREPSRIGLENVFELGNELPKVLRVGLGVPSEGA